MIQTGELRSFLVVATAKKRGGRESELAVWSFAHDPDMGLAVASVKASAGLLESVEKIDTREGKP